MLEERNIYLKSTDLDTAIENYLLKFVIGNYKEETVKVVNSLGRKTSKAVFALYSSPNYNAAAMDGILVKASETNAASENTPFDLIRGIHFEDVDTGDPINDNYDAVIMIEDVNAVDDNIARIIKPAAPWQNIRAIGEDIVAGEMIIPENHKIRPVDIGALLSGGITEVKVLKKITVGIIPTGTEIIEPGENIAAGNIIESNSRIFEGLTIEYNAEPKRYSIVEDNYEKLKDALIKSVEENDITVINAGSSAGREDYTPKLIRELGEVFYHGLAIKPGKPAVLGMINMKPVIGVPGYPVSAYIVYEKVVKEVIKKYQNEIIKKQEIIKAKLSRRVVSSLINKEFVRVKIGKVGENIIATPLDRGAGVLMSLVKSDGFLVLPQNSEGFEAGEIVGIEKIENDHILENTIVSIGSHDIVMDIINNYIHKKDSLFSLSSAHTGSMGGIVAIKKKEAHIAPIHLLDEESGEYNVSYMKKYLKEVSCVLVKGIGRMQGIIVEKGNPYNITEVKDLIREGVTFVNRQRGSGTRLLFDYLLKTDNIDPAKIIGYNREMTTHMSVAAAVQSKSAVAGVGVFSAAKVLNLDFIPLREEEYDFVIPEEYLSDKKIKIFIQVLKDEKFKEEVRTMGGYTFENSGKVIKV